MTHVTTPISAGTGPDAASFWSFSALNGAAAAGRAQLTALGLADANDSVRTLVGGAGAVSPQVLRITLASDDVLVSRFGATGDAAAADEAASAGVIAILKGVFRDLRARLGANSEAAAADETASSGITGVLKGIFRDVRARIGAVGDAAWSSGNGSVIALLKTIATQAADVTTPSPITRGGTIIGYQTLTGTLSGSVALPSIPAGTKSVMLAAEGQSVRFNPGGTATATSFPIIAGQPAYEFPGTAASLAAARAIQQAAGATLHIFYVG